MTSPSIATLEDILEALGTSLFFPMTDERVVFTANDYFINEQEAYDFLYCAECSEELHGADFNQAASGMRIGDVRPL